MTACEPKFGAVLTCNKGRSAQAHPCVRLEQGAQSTPSPHSRFQAELLLHMYMVCKASHSAALSALTTNRQSGGQLQRQNAERCGAQVPIMGAARQQKELFRVGLKLRDKTLQGFMCTRPCCRQRRG